MMGFIRLLFCFKLASLLHADSKAQKVSQIFDTVILNENFDSSSTSLVWPTMNNADNLFVVDKGSYYLYRRSIQASYVILPKFTNELSSFQIKSSLKLAPSETNEQTIGILCMGQNDGKSAIVFEINKSKQYRVKQFMGDYIKFISGDKENMGWVKSSFINPADEYNTLELRTHLGEYDLYINGNYLSSFSVAEYKFGGIGIVIGPATKAKCDYFYVYTNGSALSSKQEADTHSKLNAVINQLTEENNLLKARIDSAKFMIQANEILEKQIAEVRSENDYLKGENKALMDTLAKLSVVNEELMMQLKNPKLKTPSKNIGQTNPSPNEVEKVNKTTSQSGEAKTIINSEVSNTEQSSKTMIQPIPVKVKKAVKRS